MELNINGQYVFEALDDQFVEGNLGLLCWAMNPIEWDNLLVSPPLLAGSDPYADAVLQSEIQPGNNSNSASDPAMMAGAPDNLYTSLGGQCSENPGPAFAVFDMGPDAEAILDGPGADLEVIEIGSSSGGVDESYRVEVGDGPDGPWTILGIGDGQQHVRPGHDRPLQRPLRPPGGPEHGHLLLDHPRQRHRRPGGPAPRPRGCGTAPGGQPGRRGRRAAPVLEPRGLHAVVCGGTAHLGHAPTRVSGKWWFPRRTRSSIWAPCPSARTPSASTVCAPWWTDPIRSCKHIGPSVGRFPAEGPSCLRAFRVRGSLLCSFAQEEAMAAGNIIDPDYVADSAL
jgi:hypothetical protein